jgi:hypothetical protein
MRQMLSSRGFIILVLILQIIPLLLFPLESFSPTSQEWWLPALLAVLVLVADFEVIVRGTVNVWPWTLMSFAQGFNIISRLMMIWPHAGVTIGGVTIYNIPYIILTVISILLSAVLIWFIDQQDVRNTMVRLPA